jgi:hypothetical protein
MVVAIKDKFCGIIEAAEVLGCTAGRVRQLLQAGELVGEKYGDHANAPWLVERRSLASYAKKKPSTGRPRINEVGSAE